MIHEFKMKRLPLFLIALACVAPLLIAQRGGAPAPPELTAEQRNQYQAKIAELDSIVKGLRSKGVNQDLIADVDIYSKAGAWLLEYPQGFVNPQGIATYLGVLDEGLERQYRWFQQTPALA